MYHAHGVLNSIFQKNLPGIINAAIENDEIDYWAILGDNFYDRYGTITSKFFD